MSIYRRAIVMLAIISVAIVVGSCGKAGPGTAQKTTTATTTETVTAEPSVEESPSPSFSTDAEFIAAIRESVPYSESLHDDEIIQEEEYICDVVNNRGATRDEVAQTITENTRMTNYEAYTFIDLSLQYCY
ncbi:hypothetical protein [Streptomyces sviceus]|uniref:hypothetical protein n=1 Tax=Streptomyces sviceus TaxID=285530 RepID=UPI0036E44A02